MFHLFPTFVHLYHMHGKKKRGGKKLFPFIGGTLLMEKYSGISIVFQLCGTSPVWAAFVLDDVIHA